MPRDAALFWEGDSQTQPRLGTFLLLFLSVLLCPLPFFSLLSSVFQNLVFKFHSLQGFFDVIDERSCGRTASWLPVNSLFMHLEAKGVLTDLSGAHGPVRLSLPRHGVVMGPSAALAWPWAGRGSPGRH